MMAVHTQQMLTVGAVLVLAGVCAMARPSGPEVPRETRAASGFKFVSSPFEWAYMTSTFIPQYTHHDIARLASTSPSLHPHTTSWLHHDRLRTNNYLTTHHPSFSFGLPLLKMAQPAPNLFLKMSPPTSNMYMVFNGRLAVPNPTVKHINHKGIVPLTTSHIFNTYQFSNPLPEIKVHSVHNAVEESSPLTNPVLVQRKQPSHYSVVRDIINDVSRLKTVSPKEIQNNIDTASVSPKVTPQILPEVTLNVAGNTYDIIPTTVSHSKIDEKDLNLIKGAVDSIPENNGEEANVSKPEKPTSLILKPIAKAVAGAKGVAIAAPLSRAVVRKGEEVNIHFNPEAVAVVGPGGLADAHSDLIISYFPDRTSEKPKEHN